VDHDDARAYAERFLPDRVARAYADEYRRLLAPATVAAEPRATEAA
ncbi:MAG: hypothetical protein QOG63_2246, partial [Thermoleophilaceae bacterium]|nr:hypothetical protein [Thermoleophilaceae bacterium]